MSDTRPASKIPAGSDPSMAEFLRTIMYFSLFPMIILMPIWFAFGRSFFGAGGWGIFMTLPLALVVVFPYHILIATLAFLGKKAKLSRRSHALLLSYYIFAILGQLSFVDGGDTSESVGSAFTFSGVPDLLNTVLFIVSFLGAIFAMIGIVVSLIRDITDRKRQAPNRRS